MKLYLLEQDAVTGYDTFDRCVVAASSASAARMTHPYGNAYEEMNEGEVWNGKETGTWCASQHVLVTYIGEAAPNLEADVVVASFNAG